MAKFDTKVNGNTVDADEYNNIVLASKNLIEDSGQTIDATNTQQSKAVANYVGVADFYTDSGTANTYVLSTIGSFEGPTAYTDGMKVRFRPGNASSAASTVNVNSLGVKNIKLADGTTDISAEILTTKDTTLRYDSGNDAMLLSTESVASASETTEGIAEIATQAEVDAETDDLRFITPLKLAAKPGLVAQIVNTETGAVATGIGTIPVDDTIPQNWEGDQYMSLSITPKSATNVLKIDIVVNAGNNAIQHLAAALFQDSTVNALATGKTFLTTAIPSVQIVFSHYMTAGTASSTTFKVRVGGSGAGTTTFNGSSSARLYGGSYASSITITEYQV